MQPETKDATRASRSSDARQAGGQAGPWDCQRNCEASDQCMPQTSLQSNPTPHPSGGLRTKPTSHPQPLPPNQHYHPPPPPPPLLPPPPRTCACPSAARSLAATSASPLLSAPYSTSFHTACPTAAAAGSAWATTARSVGRGVWRWGCIHYYSKTHPRVPWSKAAEASAAAGAAAAAAALSPFTTTSARKADR